MNGQAVGAVRLGECPPVYVRKMNEQKIPIACNMRAFDENQRRRYEELRKRLTAVRQEIREDPDAYSFRLQPDAGVLTELVEWITLERLCCPFLQFTIDVSPADGPVWLTLGHGSEIKEFLKQEFSRPGATGLYSVSPPRDI